MEKEMDLFNGKLIKIGGSLAVTIPKESVEYSGLQEGQIVRFYYKILK